MGDAGVESAITDAPELRARRATTGRTSSRWASSTSCRLPRTSPGWWRAVIKDWQINGIFSAFSGTPFTIAGDNTALSQRHGPADDRPDLRPPSRRATPDPTRCTTIRQRFAQPGNKWGNTGRNFLRGPGQWNLDFSVFRAIPFGRYRAEFRAEASNVLNHTRWGNPVTGFTDPNFMRVRSNQPARRVQLGLRFQF